MILHPPRSTSTDTLLPYTTLFRSNDQMLALQAQSHAADTQAPAASGLSLDQLNFRYAITGDSPPWKPVRAFDDGQHVYIQFPAGIAQGELPPLFVVGPDGKGELVNYRFHAPYDIVDRLFGAAELRLGGKDGSRAAVVRIERTDGLATGDRKSVVEGKSVSGRVDIGG